MTHNFSFPELVERYLTDSITSTEEKAFFAFLEFAENRALLNRIIDEKAADGSYAEQEDHHRLREISFARLEEAIRAYEEMEAPGHAVSKRRIRGFFRQASVAAAILLILCMGAYFIYHKPSAGFVRTEQRPENRHSLVLPGGNRATLQLDNGKTILLDSAHEGLLAQQGNVRMVKLKNGVLSVMSDATQNKQAGIGGPTPDSAAIPASAMSYNTITTPRGGQYHLILPDGTRVWLNAASSLRFPVSFSGHDRTVTMTGEAYFEVAENAGIPFHVKVNDLTVDVLGTHFDIMAYKDESAVKTTLLEGAVKVSHGREGRLLKPGQQAVLTNEENVLSVHATDVDQVIAWKNGLFEFEDKDLATIMRQISRWYDVDVQYLVKDQDTRFGGGFSRQLNLPDLLHLLETNGVHFKLEGRTIFVIP